MKFATKFRYTTLRNKNSNLLQMWNKKQTTAYFIVLCYLSTNFDIFGGTGSQTRDLLIISPTRNPLRQHTTLDSYARENANLFELERDSTRVQVNALGHIPTPLVC